MEFDLLSNGNIENYPKKVFMKTFKVRHWRDLEISTDEGVDKVLTECLDDVIDFEKTGFVKTSSDLTVNDRKYLFFQQRGSCLGSDIRGDATCDKCEKKFPIVISLTKIKEEKLNHKVKPIEKNGIRLSVPVASKTMEINQKIQDWLHDGIDSKYATLKTYKDEITKEDKQIKVVDDDIIEKLFEWNFFDQDFSNVEEFLDFYMDLEGTVLNFVAEYKVLSYHGFDNKLDFTCKHCGASNGREVPLDIKFFL